MNRPLETHLAPSFGAHLTNQETQATEPETSVMVRSLVEDAVQMLASDVHCDPHAEEYRIRFRIDGALHDVAAIDKEEGRRTLRYLRTLAELDPPKPHEPQNGRVHIDIQGAPWEIRLSTAPAAFGEKYALRLLSHRHLEMRISQLGMTADTLASIENWAQDCTGMLIVAGPTGSGKTTTLYALLHELKVRQRSIVTIEDPVEYRIEGVTQLQVHEANGLTFAEGLKAMLRLDPDYLLVGEIRDAASAATAIDAASAGRILMSTLHCRDAVGAVTMLRNYEVLDYEIAAALQMVVAQRLVRRLCTKCSELAPPSDDDLRWLERMHIGHPEACWRAVGCNACNRTGYHGRLGVFEVWQLAEEFEHLILAHADESHLRRSLLAMNHAPLLHDGLVKSAQGCTTLEELRSMGALPLENRLPFPPRSKM